MTTVISILFDQRDQFRKALATCGLEAEVVGESIDGLDYLVTFDDPADLYWLGREYQDIVYTEILKK